MGKQGNGTGIRGHVYGDTYSLLGFHREVYRADKDNKLRRVFIFGVL